MTKDRTTRRKERKDVIREEEENGTRKEEATKDHPLSLVIHKGKSVMCIIHTHSIIAPGNVSKKSGPFIFSAECSDEPIRSRHFIQGRNLR